MSSIYKWKHLYARPSAYRWLQMGELLKLKIDSNIDFTEISSIDWDRNEVTFKDSNYLLDSRYFTEKPNTNIDKPKWRK